MQTTRAPFWLRGLWAGLLLVLLTGLGLPARASTLVSQTFATTPANWTLGGSAAINTGWLRLTNTSTNAFGYAFYQNAFSVNQGFVIDFEFVSWGGTGADGLTMFLFDGALANGSFRIGAAGGSLGYANDCSNGDGMSRAYIGIAFDEFGNFSNPADRCKSGGPGAVANAVTVRGAGDYTTGAVGSNYAYLTHSTAATSIDCPTCTTRPTNTSAEWRRARITMLSNGASAWSVYVDVQFGAGQPFTRIIAPYTLPTSPYSTLKIGFAGATGGSTNYHEIRNLRITNPVDTTITKASSVTESVVNGPNFTYTLTATNTNITAAANLVITDVLPTQVTHVSSVGAGGLSCSYASGTRTTTCTMASLATSASASATITVKGSTTAGVAANTATVDQDDIDINPNNNTATNNTTIWALPSLMVAKSANSSTASPGTNVVYTVQTVNSGGKANSWLMSDTFPQSYLSLNLNYAAAGQPFQFIDGATASGSTLGTPQYSNNNGSTWTYTPVSGGGGAPAGYDGNITNFRIPVSTMNGSGASFSVRYGAQVK